jgi:hypothetical protein
MLPKISKNLVGVAGEYYVCAELCRRGILALVTPKNNPLYDIVAADPLGSRSVSIQVKTMSLQNKQGWRLNKDICTKRNNPNLFVVLVKLNDDGTNDYYIYEYDVLSERISCLYEDYMNIPKRDGSTRRDVDFRWFDLRYFTEDDYNRRNNWDVLDFTVSDNK